MPLNGAVVQIPRIHNMVNTLYFPILSLGTLASEVRPVLFSAPCLWTGDTSTRDVPGNRGTHTDFSFSFRNISSLLACSSWLGIPTVLRSSGNQL